MMMAENRFWITSRGYIKGYSLMLMRFTAVAILIPMLKRFKHLENSIRIMAPQRKIRASH
jgi:hypothetical protein